VRFTATFTDTITVSPHLWDLFEQPVSRVFPSLPPFIKQAV
jgi:hypothetical protein